MTDTTTVVAVPSDRTTNFDWGAIVGGALIASALSFVLLTFGSAAGLASVSPYSWNNPSGTTLTIIGAAWVSVVMMGSFLVGGYFAGRYRRPVGSASVKERESRDGAHGLLMWAVALIIGIGLAYCIAAAAARGVATVAGGAATVAAQNVAPDRMSGVVDRMMRVGPGDSANPTRVENPRAEVARVLGSGAISGGEITPEDRDYAARIIAAEAKIPQEEARRRVDAGIEQAKQAANTARKIAISFAFLIGALSILSAGAAYWAAIAGGREREDNVWR
jgi:hypothetical protein